MEEKLRTLPNESGVYQYYDEFGKLLYVGKAKVLKNRVKSYFQFTPKLTPNPRLGPRIYKMISETFDLKIIVTDSESDALILENSLIKQLKPKYNILLRDDKTYPYIYIDSNDEFPRFDITRKVIKGRGIKYFGPFTSGSRDILNAVYDIFPLVQKKSCVKGGKACLFHQIHKCHAPCEGKISQEEYQKILDEATDYIEDKQKILKKLEEKMFAYSEDMNFEEAGKLRDMMVKIKASVVNSSVDLATTDNFDVFAIAHTEKRACSVRMFIRHGKIISSISNQFKYDFGFDLDEAYKRSFFASFSKDMPVISTKIYLKENFEDSKSVKEWLDKSFDKKFELITPERGSKKKIVDLAFKNAEELLKLDSSKTMIEDSIKEFFDLTLTPNRVETFDNSHLGGEYTVGAMVVSESGKFSKGDFRHYNLESKDEYSQMRELLVRRVESFEKNSPPDLWIIDGGETLRRLAVDILESVGVAIDVVAIAKEKIDAKAHRAKGSARDVLHYNGNEYRLNTADPKLHFFQKNRDESHRFVIEFHRKQKRKGDMAIKLTDIKGIGEAKVKRLIDYFGTFEEIKKASLQDLSTVLNSTDGQKILEFFKSKE